MQNLRLSIKKTKNVEKKNTSLYKSFILRGGELLISTLSKLMLKKKIMTLKFHKFIGMKLY